MIIDAHHHLWTADYLWLQEPHLAPLRRDYTVDDLLPTIAAAGVDGTVLVESGSCTLAETRHFLALAAATPQILGVVGWACFTDPDLATTIGGLRELPGGDRLVGIRDQVQGVHDPGYLARPDVRAAFAAIGAAGLACDLVVRHDQLSACAAAVAATPHTVFVLDHLGKPRITPDGLAEWRTLIAPIAALPNCTAKLSGLLTEAGPDWTPAGVRPFVEAALELFGADRLMFGSDWPVCTLVASYPDTLSILDALSPAERAAVLGDNAARTYRLEVNR
jgi:L-fuconolactonase